MRPTSKPDSSELYFWWKGGRGLKQQHPPQIQSAQTDHQEGHPLQPGLRESVTRDLAPRGLGPKCTLPCFPCVLETLKARRSYPKGVLAGYARWALGRNKCKHPLDGHDLNPGCSGFPQTKVPADELTKKKLQNKSSHKTESTAKPTGRLAPSPHPPPSHKPQMIEPGDRDPAEQLWLQWLRRLGKQPKEFTDWKENSQSFWI